MYKVDMYIQTSEHADPAFEDMFYTDIENARRAIKVCVSRALLNNWHDWNFTLYEIICPNGAGFSTLETIPFSWNHIKENYDKQMCKDISVTISRDV